MAKRPAPTLSTDGISVPMGGNGMTLEKNLLVTAGAYSAGDQVGQLVRFDDVALFDGGGGVITHVVFVDDAGQDVDLEAHFFNVAPVDAGDNAAFAPGEAGLEGWLGAYCTTNSTDGWLAAGTPSVCSVEKIVRWDCPTASKSLWMLIVTRGTPTFAATDDITIRVGILQD